MIQGAEGPNHQSVPGGQKFVVLVKGSPALAVFPYFRQKAVKGVLGKVLCVQEIGDAFPFKIPPWGNPKILVKGRPVLFPQQFDDFLRGKNVIFPFFPVAVGVLGAGKPALRPCHFPEDIAGGFFRNLLVQRFLCDFISPAISKDQQGVVVEHFLKVGRQVKPVGGIPAEPIPDVVK